MRNSGQKRITVIFGILLAVLMVSGCAAKHSDVMVFGTNTNYGVTVAMTMPENTPHLNIGYKRQEAVWMPLAINADKSAMARKVKGGSEANDIKYIGKERVEGNVIKEDTYSVLASFGSKVRGSQGNVSSGIAQYFATGVAAQQLASLGGASLVNASDENLIPSAAAVKAANEPFVAARETTFTKDESSESIIAWLWPDGVGPGKNPNQDNVNALNEWIDNSSIGNLPIQKLLDHPDLINSRKKAIKDLSIPEL